MNEKIKIILETDPAYDNPQIIIRASEKTELIDKIIEGIRQYAKDDSDARIAVKKDDSDILIDKKDIIRIYTESRRLKICTSSGIYESRLALREFEEALDSDKFVRISRAEIVNLKKVSGFDLSFAGTIKVIFIDKSETWVARRYVKDLQKRLALLRKGGDRYE